VTSTTIETVAASVASLETHLREVQSSLRSQLQMHIDSTRAEFRKLSALAQQEVLARRVAVMHAALASLDQRLETLRDEVHHLKTLVHTRPKPKGRSSP
jgi:chromosome segregation ATPase